MSTVASAAALLLDASLFTANVLDADAAAAAVLASDLTDTKDGSTLTRELIFAVKTSVVNARTTSRA
jgi:2-keto-3-deoxy-galactonokinase